MNKSVNYGGELINFQSGMASGSRNTMRDNTLLSAAYIATAEQIIFQQTQETIKMP